MKRFLVAGSLVCLGLCACSNQLRRNDWEAYNGPGKEAFLKEELRLPLVQDPVEPYNRIVSGMNHGVVVGLVSPVATGYRFLFPPSVRKRIGNVFRNLRWPVRLLGNLLQGEFVGAGVDTSRFLINTTVGVVGIFDPAIDWGLEPADEDVGKAFAAWGWEESDFFVLPFFGPSTFRDACAYPFDALLDPATYLIGGSAFRSLNENADSIQKYEKFVHTNYDPYVMGKAAFILTRGLKPKAFGYVSDKDPAVETLGAVYLTYENKDFPGDGDEEEVEIASTGRDLPYTMWLQDDPAPLVFILPGLGGHRDSDSSIGLAEMVWKRGYSAVTISSAMNWEFMENGSSVAVPGLGPIDARDVHVALDTIARDIEDDHPGQVSSRHLMGRTLGAFHTLFIAAKVTDPEGRLIRFDRMIALNPPVVLAHALGKLDEFLNAPLALPEGKRDQFIMDLIGKVFEIYKKGEMDVMEELPFSQMEAEFLIGLAFRITLIEVIMCSQNRIDLGVLKTERSSLNRTSAYHEIAEYSYAEYMLAFALPYFMRQDPSIRSVEDLVGRNNLRQHEEALRASNRVRIFTNKNDFLLTAEDRDWLKATFGANHVIIEEEGGHLGNLHEPRVQEEIMRTFIVR